MGKELRTLPPHGQDRGDLELKKCVLPVSLHSEEVGVAV